jgi:hypothetical protein
MTKREKVSVDFFTLDPGSDEFVMYLVEEGPWGEEALEERLRALQARIYDAVDVAIDGHLDRVHPTSHGHRIRIQVDLHDDAPNAAEDLVRRLASHIEGSQEYVDAITSSEHIDGLRIVVGRRFSSAPGVH